ncbi:hypothetical protein WJU23_15390 [Prosthecobacter sp. SYSU 5D2]|uniref:hypothetical protein n=1 Tax=Prosthecobacter sp. SYSU 5D2 TaxID=3134134 RepID=UPI0031FF2C46
MKTKNTLKSFICSLCLLPLAGLAASITPMPGGGSFSAGAAAASLAFAGAGSGIDQNVHTVGWPPFRRPMNPVSIRPLPNGGVQATLRGGCYVICDAYGRVLKENSCSKAELIIATRAARDYLSRRRW